jgi:hypothetical protein
MATMADAARYIDVDEIEFIELLDLGVITRQIDGDYSLTEVSRNYIRHMRKVIAGTAPDTPSGFKRSLASLPIKN